MHMSQLMPMPLTVSCFSKIQIGFTFLVPAHLGSPGKRAAKRVCVCGGGSFVLYQVLKLGEIWTRGSKGMGFKFVGSSNRVNFEHPSDACMLWTRKRF